MPAGSVPCGLAHLVERVKQRESRTRSARRDLEAKRVGAPTKLEQLRRIDRENLAFEIRLCVARLELQTRSLLPLPHDLLREPRLQVLGLRDRLPNFLRLVSKIAGETKSPFLTGLLELAVHVYLLLPRVDPFHRDVVPVHRDSPSTSGDTVRATRPSPAAAADERDRSAAARRCATRPARLPAAPSGAWIPRAD